MFPEARKKKRNEHIYNVIFYVGKKRIQDIDW